MPSTGNHAVAVQALHDKLRAIAIEIVGLTRQREQLEESIRALTGGEPSAERRSEYAELRISDAALKYVTETPGRHRPAAVLKAILKLGFQPTSKTVETQIGTALKRLAERGKIGREAGLGRTGVYFGIESATIPEEK